MAANVSRSNKRRTVLLKRAKVYLAHKFAILPLRESAALDAKAGKRPATPNGVKDATRKFNEFRSFVRGREDFNIGIATGSQSGVVVVDIDPRNGGDATFEALQARLGALPRTATVRTGGGGRHLYFKAPDGGLKKRVLGYGVDLLGDGAYAVAPPSKHASGSRYVWGEDAGLDDGVAEIPTAWLNEFRQTRTRPHEEQRASSRIEAGQRNTRLTELAGRLRRDGLGESSLLAALGTENQTRCDPPLDDEEVMRIATSVSSYPTPEELGIDEAERVVGMVLHQFEGGAHLRAEADGRFWRWLGTHWGQIDEQLLKSQILAAATAGGARRKRAITDEAFALLAMKQRHDDDLLRFRSVPSPIINVQNGELWLLQNGGHELRPHDPSSGQRYVLPVTYDPNASCPEYDGALGEIFATAEKPHRLIKFWHQFVGYAMQPRRPVPMVLVMFGAGANGKSKLIGLLSRLIGPGLVYSGRVEDLESTRFGIGSLFGKLLFVDDDMRAGVRLPDGVLKKISEEKLITGEHKFKDPFEFTIRTIPILIGNNLPSLADISTGMMRRLFVIRFDTQFKGSRMDRALFDRIADQEMSGVLNRALEGWHSYCAKSKFVSSPDMMAAKKEMVTHANPLAGFVSERCARSEDGSMTLKHFYETYIGWAAENGFTMKQTAPVVRRNLIHMGFNVPRRSVGRTIVGLRLRDPS